MTESKVAMIAGVGTGLSASLARRFAKAGMKVTMAARRIEKLADLEAETGGKAFTCDVTDQAQVDAWFEATAAAFGTPGLVVYNAGAYQRGQVLEVSSADFERCWKIGCLGGFHVGQAAARRMVDAGGGTIVFTGATASLRGGAGFVNLAMPKFALRALAQSMARELGPQGVHVAHVIVDGQINADRDGGYRESERGEDAVLSPDAMADSYYQLHLQHRSAWTQELDLRPWMEKF